ncbi:MAG: hypothetical protein HYR95_01070 [Candidatus Colwellbacteria bacterium]|nr:hypothetical protein [Candidatus Colwellbacteria bacterium]
MNIEIAMKRLAKKEISTQHIGSELMLAKYIVKRVKPKTINLHPLYNLAVQLNLPLIKDSLAKKIGKIKPASRQEEVLINAIVSHSKAGKPERQFL